MFQTIKEVVTGQIVEKKSKFIATIVPVENITQAEAVIKKIKKQYYDAKHNCFAYRVLEEESIRERCSDDAEPSGTAGAPMLEILRGRQLTNLVVVVTRYFGGILLGTGGLVRAYSQATQEALQKAEIVQKEKGQVWQVFVDYTQIEDFRYYCKKHQICIVKEEYSTTIELWIEIKDIMAKRAEEDIDNARLNILKYDKMQEKYL